jgi:hypothetical protein
VKESKWWMAGTPGQEMSLGWIRAEGNQYETLSQRTANDGLWYIKGWNLGQINSSILFFFQLLLPIGDQKKSGIEHNHELVAHHLLECHLLPAAHPACSMYSSFHTHPACFSNSGF